MLVSPSQADTSPEHPVPGEEAPPAESQQETEPCPRLSWAQGKTELEAA